MKIKIYIHLGAQSAQEERREEGVDLPGLACLAILAVLINTRVEAASKRASKKTCKAQPAAPAAKGGIPVRMARGSEKGTGETLRPELLSDEAETE